MPFPQTKQQARLELVAEWMKWFVAESEWCLLRAHFGSSSDVQK